MGVRSETNGPPGPGMSTAGHNPERASEGRPLHGVVPTMMAQDHLGDLVREHPIEDQEKDFISASTMPGSMTTVASAPLPAQVSRRHLTKPTVLLRFSATLKERQSDQGIPGSLGCSRPGRPT